ncbi:hypothetical protein [Nocardia alni]|uniref:hypothetical protein n=1 Tax=Nocardia alni TaxID=2815723 RepID=UPI001C24FBB4|nr:hypothetical protein [Nocardia alni]
MLIYPSRTTILDTIVPMMLARRTTDTARSADGACTAHLWGLACTAANTASGLACTVVDLDTRQVVGSPILAAAEGLLARLAGRRLRGFGLASSVRGELLTSIGDASEEETVRAVAEGSLKDRPTADDSCAAMVFDSRGRLYMSVKYTHMAELGVTSWEGNTLEDSASIDTWIDRLEAGIPSAHTWALAMTQDHTRNRAVLQRINQPLRQR